MSTLSFRHLVWVCLFILPFAAQSQTTYRFKALNAQTGKPWPNLRYEIIKNEYLHPRILSKKSDSAGVYTFSLDSYDSTGVYKLEISSQENEVSPAKYDITGVHKRLPVLYVSPGRKADSNPCGERMYSYRQKSILAIAEMPENIQAKLKSLLLNRVGDTFYKRLMLNLGQEFDIDVYNKLYHTTLVPGYYIPPAYSLCMSVLDTATCQEIYSFRINMNRDGSLIDSLDIPDIKRDPAKAGIINKIRATEIAKTKGITNGNIKGYFDAKRGSVIWQFHQTDIVGPTENNAVFTTLNIDAHSGKTFGKKKRKGYVMY